MTPLVGILWLALGLGAAALALRHAALVRAYAWALFVALALLALAFLAGDLSYAYVWAHTSLDLPWVYRLAGVWGGEEGTMLLWATAVAVCAALVAPRHARVGGVLVGFSAALVVAQLVVGAFAATDPAALARAPRGRGLADILVTPFMVVHPPVQFVAYGAMAVPAAFALASLAGDAKEPWIAPAYRWARVAWLLATLGLGLGALWAYTVLSFGGYWAWDPVETSNLLPWLALTAFLHAGKHLERHGDHALSSPLLALAAALLTLFAAFETRSGLWVSVHAFTDPTGTFEPDPAARLLAILAVHPPTRTLLAMLTAATIGVVALFLRHHVRARWADVSIVALLALAGVALLDVRFAWSLLLHLAALATPLSVGLGLLAALLLGAPVVAVWLLREDPPRRRRLDARAVMTAGVALFSVALAVTLLVDLQVVNGPDRRVFDVRAPFVVLPMVSVLTVAMALAPLGRWGALGLAALGAAGGVLAWWRFPDARVVALSAPFLAAALAATLLRLAHAQGRADPWRRRAGGLALLLAGIVAIAVGSNAPTPALTALGVAAGALALVGGVVAGRGALDGVRLRETGIYVVHVAVILGLVGYAASTYSQERATFAGVPVGGSVELDGRPIVVGAPEVESSGGRLDRVVVPLEVDGRSAPLAFDWRGTGYAPALHILRGPLEDVYVSPLAFHTPPGWSGATSATAQRVAAEEVDAVTFTVAFLPLVGLVWAGLWMGLVGMSLVVAGATIARRAAGAAPRTEGEPSSEAPASASP